MSYIIPGWNRGHSLEKMIKYKGMKKGTLSLSIHRCINYGKTFCPAQILKSGGVILVLQVPTFSSASYAQEPASYTSLYVTYV